MENGYHTDHSDQELEPGPAGAEEQPPRFPLRRAASDWAVLDDSRAGRRFRSEFIRRIADMFDQRVWAEQARQAEEDSRRARRPARAAAADAATPAWPLLEREVVLVPLSPPPRASSRNVEAILALGSRQREDSDDEGDEADDEQLWAKVRAKISARREKFRRMAAGEPDPEPSRKPVKTDGPKRQLSNNTSWITNGRAVHAPAPARQVSLSSAEKMSPPARGQTSPPVLQQPTNGMRRPAPSANGRETTRSCSGKYIEQNEEQMVLQSIGNAVLAKQKLAARQKTRDKLALEKSEAERRKKKAESQRTAAQNKLAKLKGKLTRDSVFERKGVEEHIKRLDASVREETQTVHKIAQQLSQMDASLQELRLRAGS